MIGIFRHKKRRTLYTLVGNGLLQTDKPITDNAQLAFYTDAQGNMWARPVEEFHDGRFEHVPQTHSMEAIPESQGGTMPATKCQIEEDETLRMTCEASR